MFLHFLYFSYFIYICVMTTRHDKASWAGVMTNVMASIMAKRHGKAMLAIFYILTWRNIKRHGKRHDKRHCRRHGKVSWQIDMTEHLGHIYFGIHISHKKFNFVGTFPNFNFSIFLYFYIFYMFFLYFLYFSYFIYICVMTKRHDKASWARVMTNVMASIMAKRHGKAMLAIFYILTWRNIKRHGKRHDKRHGRRHGKVSWQSDMTKHLGHIYFGILIYEQMKISEYLSINFLEHFQISTFHNFHIFIYFICFYTFYTFHTLYTYASWQRVMTKRLELASWQTSWQASWQSAMAKRCWRSFTYWHGEISSVMASVMTSVIAGVMAKCHDKATWRNILVIYTSEYIFPPQNFQFVWNISKFQLFIVFIFLYILYVFCTFYTFHTLYTYASWQSVMTKRLELASWQTSWQASWQSAMAKRCWRSFTYWHGEISSVMASVMAGVMAKCHDKATWRNILVIYTSEYLSMNKWKFRNTYL